MTKIKRLRLVNFGGYEDHTFEFETENGSIKPLGLFYGPNGIGKSTILEAIKIVSNPLVFKGRTSDPAQYLRSLIRDDDYRTGVDLLTKEKRAMRVEAEFSEGQKVVLTNEGFIVNELEKVHNGHAYYIDADNPMNMSRFQLMRENAPQFIKMAELIYGFPCDLDGEVKNCLRELDGSQKTVIYFQDVILTKGTCKVHFSRMSAGEKKIATLIRHLCNPDNLLGRGIVLIDNVELHIYYKRHAKTIDAILSHVGDRQLICTTHSSVMIDYVDTSHRYDLELYRKDYAMLNDSQPPKDTFIYANESSLMPDDVQPDRKELSPYEYPNERLAPDHIENNFGKEVRQPAFGPIVKLKIVDDIVVYLPESMTSNAMKLPDGGEYKSFTPYLTCVRMDLISEDQVKEDVANGEIAPDREVIWKDGSNVVAVDNAVESPGLPSSSQAEALKARGPIKDNTDPHACLISREFPAAGTFSSKRYVCSNPKPFNLWRFIKSMFVRDEE